MNIMLPHMSMLKFRTTYNNNYDKYIIKNYKNILPQYI